MFIPTDLDSWGNSLKIFNYWYKSTAVIVFLFYMNIFTSLLLIIWCQIFCSVLDHAIFHLIVDTVTAVILYLCNLQIAFFCAISVSYRRWLINSMFIIIVIFFLSNLPFYPSDINFFASDDLACFLPKFGSFKAICQAKSHQNITAKVIVVVHFAILDAGQ